MIYGLMVKSNLLNVVIVLHNSDEVINNGSQRLTRTIPYLVLFNCSYSEPRVSSS